MKQITLFLVSVFLLSSTASSFAAEDTMMMKDKMMSHDAMMALENVTGGKQVRGIFTPDSASGHASMSYMDGNFVLHAEFMGLAAPQGDDFYEGWAVQRSPFMFISTGKLELKDGKYVNHFMSSTDYSSYDFYVLTLEPNDGDAAPADHIFEGEISMKSMMMKKDESMMMKKDESMMMKKDESMMQDDTMTEKQKMMMAKKQSIRERIQSKVKNISQKKIDIILERIVVLRVKINASDISEAKKTSYNETLDIFVEVLQGDDMMMKDTMIQK